MMLAIAEWYWLKGQGFSIAVAVLTFVMAWLYCVSTSGFMLGLGLGWLAAGILAFITYWAVRALWGVVVVVLALSAIWFLWLFVAQYR